MKNKYNYNKKELLFYNVLLISYVSYKVRKNSTVLLLCSFLSKS